MSKVVDTPASLAWYICVRRFVLHNAFTFRDRSKVVDLSVLVACLFFCSVTRICIRERFWSRIVDNLYKHPSNTYIVIYSDLLRKWTLHKFPYGKFKQVIDVSSLYPSINSFWASYVARSGWFSPSPPQNKLICFSYAVLLFVVEWRQNSTFLHFKENARFPFVFTLLLAAREMYIYFNWIKAN